MRTDYKESAVKRKDFRHSKDDPQIPKRVGKRKGAKTHKLVVKDFSWKFGNEEPKDYVLGTYKNKQGAEQALKNQQYDLFWGQYEMQIEEI